MKGRGVRAIKTVDLKNVTPDAVSKDHFVIVNAVSVCEMHRTDVRPMGQENSVALENLWQHVVIALHWLPHGRLTERFAYGERLPSG